MYIKFLECTQGDHVYLTSLFTKCFSPFKQSCVLLRVFSSPSSNTERNKFTLLLYSSTYNKQSNYKILKKSKLKQACKPDKKHLPTVYVLLSVILLIVASEICPVSGCLTSTVSPVYKSVQIRYINDQLHKI